MIDRVAARLGRRLYEVPVGFKWFVDGLLDGSLGFGGEESAGASFLRRDGTVWTTDKDGIAAALLAAEITARTGRDPGLLYRDLARDLGAPGGRPHRRAGDARAEEAAGAAVAGSRCGSTELAGEPIREVLSRAPGNDAPSAASRSSRTSGWFAARPSGTEDIYKIYGESFRDEQHLQSVLAQAQLIVDATLSGE